MENKPDFISEAPVTHIFTKNGEKYVNELDETKTKIIDRYRIGKMIGKVCGSERECSFLGWICSCIRTDKYSNGEKICWKSC